MLHQRRNGASGQTRRLLITRFLLALGIIAALVMAAYKPARGISIGGQTSAAIPRFALSELSVVSARGH